MKALRALAFPVAAAGIGLLVAALMAMGAGENPFEVLGILFRSAFGSRVGLGYTLYYATPLLLTGLAVALPFRAGLFNVGAEGQLLMGALGVGFVATRLATLPAFAAIPLGLLAAIVCGGLWGALAGWIRARRNAHEVIVTILLNIVAAAFVNWAIVNPLRDRGSQVPQTPAIGAGFHLPQVLLPGTPVNVTLLLALALSFALHYLLTRTTIGFEIRAAGANPRAALAAARIPPTPILVGTMALGGALAGLVGVNEVMGQAWRLKDGFSPGYGFIGIAVALLGRGHPPGIILAALFFGALHKGASGLDLDTEHVSRDLAEVMQAVVILIVAVEGTVRGTLFGRRRNGADDDPAPVPPGAPAGTGAAAGRVAGGRGGP